MLVYGYPDSIYSNGTAAPVLWPKTESIFAANDFNELDFDPGVDGEYNMGIGDGNAEDDNGGGGSDGDGDGGDLINFGHQHYDGVDYDGDDDGEDGRKGDDNGANNNGDDNDIDSAPFIDQPGYDAIQHRIYRPNDTNRGGGQTFIFVLNSSVVPLVIIFIDYLLL